MKRYAEKENRKQGMKKQGLLLAAAVLAGVLVGCGGSNSSGNQAGTQAPEPVTEAASQSQASEPATEAASQSQAPETSAPEGTETEKTGGDTSQEEVTILVAAAASLKNAYEQELIPLFESQNPGITVEGTYDSSGKLQTQIEEGLEADVFMSAAMKQMNALDDEGMIASDTMVRLLENKIVLIVPAGGEEGFTQFTDLASADSIALGDPASVPAGQYAEEALGSLGIWEEIQDRVSFGTNVTEVLNQVAAGSADAGIVYATDAASMADQVTVVAEAPEGSLKDKVIYPVAVVKDTAHEPQARAFVEFLQSEQALEIFRQYGFADGR